VKKISVVAHRGFSEKYPENTMLAFQKAARLGVEFIELDARETKDGEIVVIHDASVNRTTGAEGYVKELSFGEIKRLDAGKWKGFENAFVPSLDEVLQALHSKTKLLVEIKEASPRKIVKLVKKHGMEQSVIIGSFNIEYLVETRKTAPEIPTAFITGSMPETPDILTVNGIEILDINYRRFERARAREFIQRGISLSVWTVDDEDDMKKLAGEEISFITTNRPDVLQKVLRSFAI